MPSRRTPLVVATLLILTMTATGADRVHKTLASPLVDEGSGPDGCTPALNGRGGQVTWEVRIERLLPDGKALVETSREADEARYPLCIVDAPLAKDAEIELEFVAREGAIDRAAGIVMRFVDVQDYYVAQASALQGVVTLVRVINGTHAEIGARKIVIDSDRPQKLTLRAVNDRFTVWLNGEQLFEAKDGGIVAAGHFGIWSRADSFARYGDLFITVLD
jgi:hypothetical protein